MTFSWEKALQRIPVLMDRYPASRNVLNFYQAVAEFQKHLAEEIEARGNEIRISRLKDAPRTFPLVLPHFPAFLEVIKKSAPGPVGMAAHDMFTHKDAWHSLLEVYLMMGAASLNVMPRFLIRSFLQPLMLVLANSGVQGVTHSAEADVRHCSFCGEMPAVGCLSVPARSFHTPSEGAGSSSPLSDSGKLLTGQAGADAAPRSMVCSLCLTEWPVPRVACLFCAETKPRRLPRLSSEEIAHVHVEACDSCRKYIKVVDLATDGEAIPPVDDLATLSLDAAARERGYNKSDLNLAGI